MVGIPSIVFKAVHIACVHKKMKRIHVCVGNILFLFPFVLSKTAYNLHVQTFKLI